MRPAIVAAFTFVTFTQLPANEPAATAPEKTGLGGSTALPIRPPLICAADTVPLTLLAVVAKMA